MERFSENRRLLKRQAKVQRSDRQSGEWSILAGHGLFAIRSYAGNFAAAVRAIEERAGARGQSLDQIRVEDVGRWNANG